MLTTTQDAVTAILKADPSVTPIDRSRIISWMRNYGKSEPAAVTAAAPTVPRIIRRAAVADRMSVSLRTVDKYSKMGLLNKHTLPGHKRASGFLAADVDALIQGKGVP